MPETGETITSRPRRNHTPVFKANLALAAIGGEQTPLGLSQQFDVLANQIKQWKDQLLEGAKSVFGDEASSAAAAQKKGEKANHLTKPRLEYHT